jgi:translation initiation factor 1 (eIF-1/SUI1)
MAESFTSKQKEIVARKMGYDGPMQMFDEFLSASPSDAQKYSAITSKFVERMAKGGMVKKFAAGGAAISDEEIKNYIAANQGMSDKQVAAKMDELGLSVDQIARGYGLSGNEVQARYDAVKAPPATVVKKDDVAGKVTTAASTADTTVGAPTIPGATSYTAAQTGTPTAAVATNIGVLQDAKVTDVAAPTDITAPGKVTATDATAATAAAGVKTEIDKLTAATGSVSEAAKVKAEETKPADTAIKDVTAAQGDVAQVTGAPTRTEVEGEMVSGSAVDMAKAEETLAKTQAAQGTVTEDMTVQGQLNKLLTNFDAGSPPPWAAASMRAANAQMAARGIGASSMAGQAIIQATLEAATPIAAADAKVFETMGLQNLSNRQQTAILVGQQRAAFLGQEFDQAFQTRVLNAAKVSDIANKNFDAQTQIVIENARLTNSMNIAQLSADNAVVLAKAAQMASLETQNLNNRQQAAVENAKAFLMMDLKNVEMKQQTALFKAQEISDSLVSDAALSNAARITNANNALEAAKISETLTLTANQFNATERNKISLANANAANELNKFNTQQANAREEFNSRLGAEISVANAKILADVSTANTAATNAANAVNAKNATDLSASQYAQQSQTYRDMLEMSWKTGEQEKDRVTNIAVASITKSAAASAAQITADAASSAAWGNLAFKTVTNWDSVKDFASDIFG